MYKPRTDNIAYQLSQYNPSLNKIAAGIAAPPTKLLKEACGMLSKTDSLHADTNDYDWLYIMLSKSNRLEMFANDETASWLKQVAETMIYIIGEAGLRQYIHSTGLTPAELRQLYRLAVAELQKKL